MGLQIATVANSIAALSVAGVDILDIDAIPQAPDMMDTPMIIPRPDGWLSSFKPERMSFGPGSVAAFNVTYVLTYRVLHSKIGEGMGGIFGTYADLVAKVALFLDAIIANDTLTGALDVQAASVSEFGLVHSPMGDAYFGCDVGILILEYVN